MNIIIAFLLAVPLAENFLTYAFLLVLLFLVPLLGKTKITNCCFKNCSFSHIKTALATFDSNAFYNCTLSVLTYSNLIKSYNIIDNECTGFFRKIPSYGAFYGYKALAGHKLFARLLIPADAERLANCSGECRANYAIVDEILDRNGDPVNEVGYSLYDVNFEYRKGKTVIPSDYDSHLNHPNGAGIHFFLTFEEAVNYGI